MIRLILAVLLPLSSAVAQTPPPSSFQALEWRLIGPFRGGRSVAATGVPGNPKLFYFGSVGGGIWKSTDAGMVWNPIFDSEHVASIGALEVAPSNPQILYAGTGEADIRSDIAFGNGVYRSDDGGAHWRNIGLRNTFHVGRIAIDPKNPDIAYVAALGHAYAANPERGVFRTRDGGKTWDHVLDKGPDLGAVDLAIEPEDSNILYATMWQARRTPWSQYPPNQSAGSGLYKSTDAGSTWMAVTGSGLPQTQWGRAGVAIARGTGGRRVYLLVEAGKESGLYRSDDAGQSWRRTSADPRIASRAWYFGFIAVDPNNPDGVYIPNVAVLRSLDGGATFTVLRGAPGGDDYHSIWIDPTDSARMILGTDQGVSISLNQGATWSTWYNQPTAQLYHVSADNQFPYNVCGSQQDSGTVCLPSRSNHGSITERDFTSVGGNEAGWTAPDPKNPDIVFGTDVYGTVTRFDRRTSQAQDVTPWPLPAFGRNISDRKYRAPWTTPLLFSIADPTALYMGTQFLLKTTDGGLHWQTLSPDLTRTAMNDCKGAEANFATAKDCGYGVIYSIAPSPLHADQIWVGSDTGLIQLTRDGGKSWSKVYELPDWSKVTHIEPSHFDAAEAWAAVDRHRLDDYAPYLYRSRDFGKSWAPVVRGLPPGAFVNAIREDPERRGLLFAATETGVFVSFDDAEHWQPLQLNLPTVSVRDLVIHGNDLIAATHGRSFWILDDIAPLRQVTAAIAKSEVTLFRPADAVRILTESFQGTPLPPEVPAGKNPPTGAPIDYWLSAGPTTPVTLALLDAHNNLVRSYTSGDKTPAIPRNVPIADVWLTPPPGLTAKAGHNRFLWDLRYAGPKSAEAGEDDGGQARGPLVVPGNYQVQLTVGGKTYSQDLRVTQDPRSPVDVRMLENQRDLALEIISELNRASEAAAKLPDESRAQMRQVRVGLSAALAAVTSADRTPPAQAVEVFEEARASLRKLTEPQ